MNSFKDEGERNLQEELIPSRNVNYFVTAETLVDSSL